MSQATSGRTEYETARKNQSILQGRIEHLTALLRDAVQIEGSSTTHVSLGTAVTVEDEQGEETYTIVGSHEASPSDGRISSTSPVGRALMGRRHGDRRRAQRFVRTADRLPGLTAGGARRLAGLRRAPSFQPRVAVGPC